MINLKVRAKNKMFWLTMIPAALMLIKVCAELLGFDLAMDGLAGKLEELVNVVFVMLALLGVVNDPTTAGIGDSKQALTYAQPKKDG